MGDSIMSLVFENAPDGSIRFGPPKELTAAIVNQQTQTYLQNFSVPGGAIISGPLIGAGQVPALRYLSGVFGTSRGVIITLGTNDYTVRNSVPVATFQAAYTELVRQIRQDLNRDVVCVAPLPRRDVGLTADFFGAPLNELNVYQLAVLSACSAGGGVFIDSNEAFSEREVGLYASDGLHLNGRGHARFARFLIDKMVSLGFWKRIP